MSDLTRIRQRTAARLRGLELPEAFASATVSAAARTTYHRGPKTPGIKNQQRRIRAHARKLTEGEKP